MWCQRSRKAGRPWAEQGLQRGTWASTLGSGQSQGKTDNSFKQCSLASDSGFYVWGELLGPWRDRPDSGLIWSRRTCGHMPAGPGHCPRHRSWEGRGVCHPLLGPGTEPGVESLWELCPQGQQQQEETRLWGSSLLVPAQVPSPWRLTATGPHLPTLEGPGMCL